MPNFHFKGGAGRAYQGILLDKPYSGLPPTNGAHRSSVALDGVNSTFQSDESLIGVANTWTIGFWLRPSSLAADRMPVIIKPAGSDNSRIDIEMNYATGGLGIFGGMTVRLHDSAGVLKKDWDWWFSGYLTSWHHVAITWDGTEIKNYFNGVNHNTGAAKPVNNALTMTDEVRQIEVGSNSGASAGYLGWMSELQIWDVALDPDEVIDLHNNGFPGRLDLTKDVTGYTNSANLQHWYRFGYDAAKLGRDFTIVRDRLDIDSASNNVDEDEIRSASPRGSSLNYAAASHLISDATDLGFADSWTISVWVRREAHASAVRMLYQIKEAVGNENQIRARWVNPGNFEVAIFDSGAVQYNAIFDAANPAFLALGAWSNLVITHGPGVVTYYVNGVAQIPSLAGGAIGTMTNTTRKCALGANITGASDLNNGNVSDLAIWNSVLTPAEVVSLYNNGVFDRDLTENFEDYTSKSNLKQWWWIGSAAKTTEVGGTPAVRKAGNMVLTTTTTSLTYLNSKCAYQGAGSGAAPTLWNKYGQGYSLEGSTCKRIGISNIWSISGWFKHITGTAYTDDASVFDCMCSVAGTVDSNRISIQAMGDNANDPFRVTTYDSNEVLLITRDMVGAVDGVGFTSDEWRHYVVTWNGHTRTVVVYLDGAVAVQTPSGYNALGSGNQVAEDRAVSLGFSFDLALAAYMNGQICDTIVWNKELGANEVRQIYALGHTFNPVININAYRSGANVMHWWPLHDISDTNDSIGEDKVNYKGLVYHLIARSNGGPVFTNVIPSVLGDGMFIGQGPYDNTLV